MKNKLLIPGIIIGIFSLLLIFLNKEKTDRDDKFLTDTWKTYKTDNYALEYLGGPISGNVEITKHSSSLVTIRSENFQRDNASGLVEGYSIYIIYPFTNPDCNLKEFINSPDKTRPECIFLPSETGAIDYANGTINFENVNLNNSSTIKYQFLSATNKNNSIGLLGMKESGETFFVGIEYRNYKDLQFFDQILSRFKLL